MTFIRQDVDSDGVFERCWEDKNNDGVYERVFIDFNEDGRIDAVAYDFGGVKTNRKWDKYLEDIDQDGIFETERIPPRTAFTHLQKGILEIDLNGDGYIDRREIDTDQDSVSDKIFYDINQDHYYDLEWNDLNRNGISEPGETFQIIHKVMPTPKLNYHHHLINPLLMENPFSEPKVSGINRGEIDFNEGHKGGICNDLGGVSEEMRNC